MLQTRAGPRFRGIGAQPMVVRSQAPVLGRPGLTGVGVTVTVGAGETLTLGAGVTDEGTDGVGVGAPHTG